MCDTIIVTGEVTADGVTIFGKNSDREPNESHFLIHYPAAKHAPNTKVTCTYISIPQVEKTHAVLLAKPFWIWGAEMGANDQGVVIGNEAVFTKISYDKKAGLLGMDLLRLALERGSSAYGALQVITALLDLYGQGGNGGFQHKLYYHNSFIIADPRDAWLLETAGKHWAAVQVKGVRTISNGLTIGSQWDLASADLVAYAVEHGWCKGRDDFDFARCYSDFLYTKFSDCKKRQCRTTDLLRAERGKITLSSVMQTLRDHGENQRPPSQGIMGSNVCMHTGSGPIRQSQTTGSMVSYLHPDRQIHFLTGTAAPCTSVFKPVWMDSGLPDIGPEPAALYDRNTLFWRHEKLHRATLQDYPTRMRLYAAERDALEAQFIEGAFGCQEGSVAERVVYSAECFAEADEAEEQWLKRVQAAPLKTHVGFWYQRAWHKLNRAARL